MEYVIDRPLNWLIWAYKQAVEVNKTKANILFNQLFPNSDQHKYEEANDVNLQNIGIGK